MLIGKVQGENTTRYHSNYFIITTLPLDSRFLHNWLYQLHYASYGIMIQNRRTSDCGGISARQVSVTSRPSFDGDMDYLTPSFNHSTWLEHFKNQRGSVSLTTLFVFRYLK